jgi:hypothetical protein
MSLSQLNCRNTVKRTNNVCDILIIRRHLDHENDLNACKYILSLPNVIVMRKCNILFCAKKCEEICSPQLQLNEIILKESSCIRIAEIPVLRAGLFLKQTALK